jgi:hypothetical protein
MMELENRSTICMWELRPYKAPEMKFNDFLGMIIVNYFDNHKNRDKMLRALGV